MNRERLLFVVVVAIVLLWFFAIREAPSPVDTAQNKTIKLEVRPVRGAGSTAHLLELPQTGTFTLKTNETRYARQPLTVPLLKPVHLLRAGWRKRTRTEEPRKRPAPSLLCF